MRRWRKTINFKTFYHNDSLSIREKAVRASAILSKFNKREYSDDLYEIADMFECIGGEGSDDVYVAGFTEECDFNERMTELYDWADANEVWISTQF